MITILSLFISMFQVASGPFQAEPMMDLSFTNTNDNVLPVEDDLLLFTEGLDNQDLAHILGLGSPPKMNMGSPVASPTGHSPGPSSPSGQQMNMASNSENMNKVRYLGCVVSIRFWLGTVQFE